MQRQWKINISFDINDLNGQYCIAMDQLNATYNKIESHVSVFRQPVETIEKVIAFSNDRIN